MKKTICLCAAVLAAILTACRTVDSGERGFRDVSGDEHSRMLEASEKLGDGILQACRKGDFELLLRSVPGELGTQMTKKDFDTSCRNFKEKFGEITEFRLLTALDTPAFGNLIWVVTFARRGTNGNVIRRQLLFRLVTMEVDGRTEVVSLGFL